MDLKDINTAVTTVKGVAKAIKITFVTEDLKLLSLQKLKDRPYHRMPTERQKRRYLLACGNVLYGRQIGKTLPNILHSCQTIRCHILKDRNPRKMDDDDDYETL